MVTSVTGNQSLEPGTTVQDKFEYMLWVLYNALPERFEINLPPKKHDMKPLGNR